MYLAQPRPFEDARQKLNQRIPVAVDLSSEQWSLAPSAIKERAFWSARITDARFVQSMKDRLTDHINRTTQTEINPDGTSRLAFKVSGREDFIRQMLETGKDLGLGNLLAPSAELSMNAVERMKGVGPARLGLVFDTAMRTARGYGAWKEGNKQEILDTYPASQFIRLHAVAVPRPLHEEHEGEIHLKSDIKFWMEMNKREIGGFGVPWEPFGYNSGMGTRDVPRSTCIQLGLLKPGEKIRNPEIDFNEHLEASAKSFDPDVLEALKAALGPMVKQDGNTLKWVDQKQIESPKPEAPQPEKLPPNPPPLSKQHQVDNLMARVSVLDLKLKQVEADLIDAVMKGKDADRHIVRRARAIQDIREAVQVPVDERVKPEIRTRFSANEPFVKETQDLVAAYIHPNLSASVDVKMRFQSRLGMKGVYKRATREIVINTTAKADTGVHEVTHDIEERHPQIAEAARRFLLKRAGDERLVSLDGYSSDTIGFSDDWVKRGGKAYTGRFYPESMKAKDQMTRPTSHEQIGSTEVLTTGIQRMLADPIDFFRRDPEHFRLVIEQLRFL